MNWKERIKPDNAAERIFLLIVGFCTFYGLVNFVGIWEIVAPIFSLVFWGYVIWKVSIGIYNRYNVSIFAAFLSGLSVIAVAFLLLVLVLLIAGIWENDLLSWVLFLLLMGCYFWVFAVYQRRKDDFFVDKLGFKLRQDE